MGESGICFNCYLRPFLNMLKFIGIDKFQSCGADLDQGKLYRVNSDIVLLAVWLLLIWTISISLIDKETCTELCGGFIYHINDTSSSIIFAKIIVLGVVIFVVFVVSDAYFSKKMVLEVQQENFEDEIENLFHKRDKIYRLVTMIMIGFFVSGFFSMNHAITFLPMPKNYYAHVICSVIYMIILLWVVSSLINFISFLILICSFWLKRLENIIERLKNCKKFPNTMKTVLYLEEKKYAELAEMIEIVDESIGRLFTEFIVFAMNFIACCLYYAIFSGMKERLFFLFLGIILSMALAFMCLEISEIAKTCTRPIEELYTFSIQRMENEDLIKVITFMKRVNGRVVGIYYFTTTAITKEFSMTIISSIWNTFSTLLQFRKITEDSYKSKICNATLFDNLI